MRFDTSLMYYLGCFLIFVAIVLIVLVNIYMKKILKKHDELIQQLRDFEYPISVANDRLYNLDNDVYAIRQRIQGGKQ